MSSSLGSPVNNGNGRFLELKNNQYKKFQAYDGYFWRHLVEDKDMSKVVDTHGSWYKVHIKDFPKILKNYLIAETVHKYKNFYGGRENVVGNIKPLHYTSKDHMEIFICKDTKIR